MELPSKRFKKSTLEWNVLALIMYFISHLREAKQQNTHKKSESLLMLKNTLSTEMFS